MVPKRTYSSGPSHPRDGKSMGSWTRTNDSKRSIDEDVTGEYDRYLGEARVDTKFDRETGDVPRYSEHPPTAYSNTSLGRYLTLKGGHIIQWST